MNTPHQTRSLGTGLLGFLFAILIMAILATFLFRAMSGTPVAGGYLNPESEAPGLAPLPAHDGSLHSQLPQGLERKTRELQKQAEQRGAQLEALLEQSEDLR